MTKFNLEERTMQFAIAIRKFVKTLPYTIINNEDSKQLIRSSGSIGANYIEANENLGAKDFIYRLKIARKEAKESEYWLKIIKAVNKSENQEKLNHLIQESIELKKILSAIIIKIK